MYLTNNHTQLVTQTKSVFHNAINHLQWNHLFVCVPLCYNHAMLVFWLGVCSKQVAIQISICCLSKRFFILAYCELTAIASNITPVSKREKGYQNQKICSRLHLSHQTVSNKLFFQSSCKWDDGSGKPSAQSFEVKQGLLANAIIYVPLAS